MEKKEYDDRFIEEVEKITSKLRELNFSDEHIVRVLELYFRSKPIGVY